MISSIFHDAIRCALSNVSCDSKILQVGPAKKTVEYIIKPDCIEFNINVFDSCLKCPFLFECKNGPDICMDKLIYEGKLFDSVVLHAQVSLGISALFHEALRVLKSNGNILVFILNSMSGECQSLNFCMQETVLLEKIMEMQLSIQEISSMQYKGNHSICSLMLKKY